MKTRYRRLPGKRRGIFRGASMWMGDDHLLLVNSYGFREEYKRFHLRDVQAIAVARAPRFHISSRAVVIGAFWLLAVWFGALLRPVTGHSFLPYLWLLGGLLVVMWAIFSGVFSCRCRIYTAVSGDELPSVYRTWTARRFLAAVEPRIAQEQGVVEGPWAEAAEERDIGPPTAIAPAAPDAPAPAAARSHTLASDLLIGVLFAAGAFDFVTLGASRGAAHGAAIGILMVKMALAVVIFVQHYKGKLQSGMQKLAIATLLAMGVMYYVDQLAAGFAAGAEAANKKAAVRIAPVVISGSKLTSELDGGASVILGCVGLAIVLFAKDVDAA